jgi:hypothetical protein
MEMTSEMHRGCQITAAAEMPEYWMERLDGEDRMLISAHRRARPHVGVRCCTGESVRMARGAVRDPSYSGDTSMW